MPVARYVSPFPPLNLSPADNKYVIDLAHSLVDEHVQAFEEYAKKMRPPLHPKDWKLVRTDDDICTWVRLRGDRKKTQSRRWTWRTPDPVARDSLTTTSTSSTITDQEIDYNLVADFQLQGTLKGSVHDAMYGILNHTIDEVRMKRQYADDGSLDATMLATIISPTPSTPFESLAIKYREQHHRPFVRMFAKNVSFVYLEYSTMTELHNGESVGVHIMHSLEVPETAGVMPNGTTRANYSIFGLYRQVKPGVVEVLEKSAFYSGGELQRPFMIQAAAHGLGRNVSRRTSLGQMKKLVFAMHLVDKGESRLSMRVTSENCGGCKCLLSTGEVRKRGAMCRLCSVNLCGYCRVKKRICFISPDNASGESLVTFCRLCIAEVDAWDAAAISSEQLLVQDVIKNHTPLLERNASGNEMF